MQIILKYRWWLICALFACKWVMTFWATGFNSSVFDLFEFLVPVFGAIGPLATLSAGGFTRGELVLLSMLFVNDAVLVILFFVGHPKRQTEGGRDETLA